MICPNCGLENPPSARFCGNCGTTLGAAPPPNMGGVPPQGAYQGSQPYNMAGRGYNIGGTRITPARAIGLGCLILVIFFFLFSASCMRACFFPRRHTYIRRVF